MAQDGSFNGLKRAHEAKFKTQLEHLGYHTMAPDGSFNVPKRAHQVKAKAELEQLSKKFKDSNVDTGMKGGEKAENEDNAVDEGTTNAVDEDKDEDTQVEDEDTQATNAVDEGTTAVSSGSNEKEEGPGQRKFIIHFPDAVSLTIDKGEITIQQK